MLPRGSQLLLKEFEKNHSRASIVSTEAVFSSRFHKHPLL
jgi:hypothetical protein